MEQKFVTLVCLIFLCGVIFILTLAICGMAKKIREMEWEIFRLRRIREELERKINDED